MHFSGLRQPQNNVNRDGDEICEDDIQSYLPIITAKKEKSVSLHKVGAWHTGGFINRKRYAYHQEVAKAKKIHYKKTYSSFLIWFFLIIPEFFMLR